MGNQEQMLSNLKEEITSYYEHYLYLADMANVNQDIFDVLGRAKDNDTGINFLRITYAATIDSMMITFARLYDEDRNSKNINQLIRKCRNNSHLAINKMELEEKLDDFEKELSTDPDLVHAVKIIKLRRDKIFAHNDKKFFNNPENDKSYLPNYQLWMLRDYTYRLLQTIAEGYGVKNSKKTIYNQDLSKFINNFALREME